jgi:aminoglycoside phosphotransferase (APT) family kinase protein
MPVMDQEPEHNFHRGGPLATYAAETPQAIAALKGNIDINAVNEVWEVALMSTWHGSPVWVHGDISPGNLLTPVRPNKI